MNTKEQIETSFSQAKQSGANIWFLGNSRIYRGIDPSVIEDAKTYNFAHDNDSFNQIYYKFRWLKENNCKVDTVILGIDYFQLGYLSDTRNYVYDYLFDKQYAKDYGRSDISEYLNNKKREFLSLQSSSYFKILKYIDAGFRFPSKDKLPVLKNNGQYVNDIKASPNDKITRKCEIKDIPQKYFHKLIGECGNEDITLFVVMPPVRDNELCSYTTMQIDSFNKMINTVLEQYNYNNCYYNFSNVPEFKDYTCYTDITHLNSESAAKFTEYLWKAINK